MPSNNGKTGNTSAENRTMKSFLSIVLALVATGVVTAFVPVGRTKSSSALCMSSNSEDDELYRQSKWLRQAQVDDNMVELKKPLGLVLSQDDNGNVFVETVAARGNAARTGKVKEGDIVTMCSATFGEQMWSTRGVGLQRVLSAIKVRAGPTVRLVFESPGASRKKAALSSAAAKSAAEARVKAQEKRDRLLTELQQDEKKLKKGKFLGLF